MARRFRYLIALTLGLRALAAPAAAPDHTLFAAGDENIAWAWQRITSPQDEHRLVIAYTPAQDTDPRFLLLPMHPTGAEVRTAAVRGRYLHIFFKDGTHYRLRTPTSADKRDPNAKFDYPEVHLPDKRVPAAVCADATGDSLYAIVPSTTARRIVEKAAPNVDTNALPTPTPSPLPSPAPSPTPDFTAAKWALVRYIPTDWSAVTTLPPACDEQSAIWIATIGPTPHVLFASPAAPQQVQHLRLNAEGWAQLPPIPSVKPDDIASVFALADSLVVVTRRAAGSESTVVLQPHIWKDSAWQHGDTLKLDGAELHPQADRFAVTRLGAGLIVIWPHGTGETRMLHAARWPLTRGAATAKALPVVALQGTPGAAEEERTRFLITLAAMTFMVLIIMRARRDSFVHDLPVPAGFVLARLGPRALAFFLDAAAVTLLVFPILFVPWFADHGVLMDERMQERLELAYSQDPNGVYWRWLIATMIFALYCIAFEATLGATPGKLAMRLRVFNNRGEPAAFGAVVVRNLLRFEIYPVLHFFPIIVLVLFTRNRQRLGDLAGNTIVVEKTAAKP